MRKAKKLSLTLMASVMALGVIAFTAQPANASYGLNILIPFAHQF